MERFLVEPQNDTGSTGVFCTVNELFFEGQKVKKQTLHLRRKSSAMSTGIKRSSVRGRGMEFFESRPYVHQDEMRTIDWKVSARRNALFTKVFVEERERPTYLVVDLRSSMFFGSVNCFKSVLAARIASRLALASVNGGDRVGGLIFDDDKEVLCPLGRGLKSLARFFGKLSLGTKNIDKQRRLETGYAWPLVLKQILSSLHSGAAIFLISDFLDVKNEDRHLLYKLRQKADIFSLLIFDPLEERLPRLGTVGMAFGQEKIIFNSDDIRLQKNYRKWRTQHESDVAQTFSSLNIPLIKFSTADDPELGLKKIFLGQW